jgi:hypothetical protein
MLWHHAYWPRPNDDKDIIVNNGEPLQWVEYQSRYKEKLLTQYEEDEIFRIVCPICDSEPNDGSYLKAFVFIDLEELNNNENIKPVAYACPYCGFEIAKEQKYLAESFLRNKTQELEEWYNNPEEWI